MIKPFIKRAQYNIVSITTDAVKSIAIEADEAYVTVLAATSNSLSVRRERERNLKAALTTAGVTTTATTANEWQMVDALYGRVAIDSPSTDGSLMNPAVTTAANDLKTPERIRHTSVGIKETIDLKANTASFPLVVLIETIHYVPADEITI